MSNTQQLEADLIGHLNAGRLAEAVQVAGDLISADPENRVALQLLGRAAISNGDFQTAIRHLQLLADITVPRLDIVFDLVRAHEGAGEIPRAIEICQKGLRALDGDYVLLFLLGGLLRKAGRADLAATAYFHCAVNYQKRLKATPNDQALLAHKPQIDFARTFTGQSLNDAFRTELEETRKEQNIDSLPRVENARFVRFEERPITENELFQPQGFYVPELEERAWFERDEFDWVEPFEAAYPTIRSEVMAELNKQDDLTPYLRADQSYGEALQELVGSTDWGAFYFYDSGSRNDEAFERFPKTAEILDSMPFYKTDGELYEAFFSVLRPGKHITPHFGISNVRLTVHLPLIVPENCGLRAGNEARKTEAGKCLIFDDSFVHEAWNKGKSDRIVLIIEAWKPDISEDEKMGFEAASRAETEWYKGRSFEALLRPVS